MKKNKVIISYQYESREFSFNEIERIDSEFRIVEHLDSEMSIIETNLEWKTFSDKLRIENPIFTRHINPVNIEENIEGNENDINTIKTILNSLIMYFDIDNTISIQSRSTEESGINYKKYEINNKASEYLESMGFKLDIKNPQQIISMIFHKNVIYCGVSLAEENLNIWAGGKIRYKREDGQISRAEFKLMEALEVFGIDIKKCVKALDLGAAPGGWTKQLRKLNMNVAAVDPAQLDERIKKDKEVKHYKETAQVFIKKNEKFDIIVNDMKMDALESCQIMCEAAKLLNENGFGIITLKLPHIKQEEIVNRAIKRLSEKYFVENARQLFHNRSEITVILIKR